MSLDPISMQEAKKAARKVGNLKILKTNAKDNTVNAINELETILGKLIPAGPPTLSSKTLSLSGVNCYLANGVTDNSNGSVPYSGALVFATRSAYPESSIVSTFLGGKGTLSVYVNGVKSGERALDGTDSDVGTFGELIITNNVDYPADKPGFYKAISAKYKAIHQLPLGYNSVQLKHTDGGDTNIAGIVVDEAGNSPSVTAYTSIRTLVPAYTSGIPHLGLGSVVAVSASVGGIVTNVYSSSVVSVSGNGISSISYTPSQVGMPAVPSPGAQAVLSSTLTINQSYVGTTSFTVMGYHPLNGTGSASGDPYLIKVGSGGIDETKRVGTSSGDYPNESPTAPSFNSETPVASHEAKIVGGVLKHDVTNYSQSVLSGPDYSGHDTSQYACFVLPLAAKTNANINVSGSYAKCWVKLPGITGWLDTSVNYPGAGNPTANGDGCKVSGTSVTFGTNSTANCGNVIALRFKLVSGNSISSISVS